MTTPCDHLLRFSRDAGPIPWDRPSLAASRIDPEVAALLHVAAILEEDTAISARQGRALGLDRSSDIAAFLDTWVREEAEHGRALRYLLAHQTRAPTLAPPTAIAQRRRTMALVPLTALGRLPGTTLVFCALGAAAEYVAIVIYRELEKRVEPPAVAALLRSIIRQEGRHFAFFLAAAKQRADTVTTIEGRLVRRALAALWSPVGLASLGEARWHTALSPLLGDVDVRTRVEKMDRVLDSVHHLGDLDLMATFLRDHPVAPRAPVVPVPGADRIPAPHSVRTPPRPSARSASTTVTVATPPAVPDGRSRRTLGSRPGVAGVGLG